MGALDQADLEVSTRPVQNIFGQEIGVEFEEEVQIRDSAQEVIVNIDQSNRATTDDGSDLPVEQVQVRKLTQNEVPDFDGEFAGGVEFGLEGKHLRFDKPVEVVVPIENRQLGEQIEMFIRHDRQSQFGTDGLRLDATTACPDGLAANPGNLTEVVELPNGKLAAIIYTCGASEIVGGGRGGQEGGYYCIDKQTLRCQTCTTLGATCENGGICGGFSSTDGSLCTAATIVGGSCDPITACSVGQACTSDRECGI
jgi:hypothetical protein